MKSLAELEAIRKATIARINVRTEEKGETTRVVIGMATCGIAAGARPVMMAFMDEIQKRQLPHVTVSQTGCVGMCRLEPMVDVIVPGKEKVTYVKMTAEKAKEVVEKHLKGGTVVEQYTIGAYQS